MIHLTVNGNETAVPEGCTVGALIERLAVQGRYAVEVDGSIVPRSQHAELVLRPGATVEVVRAIGGG
ncbi:MAG: sulfur carrier protein ThiS [Gammaproteobacteria bacterium]